ncbi:MAG: hypothetical protein AAGF48_01460 [Pseudomonadota bacterium]
MKSFSAALVAAALVIAVQSYVHDCRWRGTDRLEVWASCLMGIRP